MLAGQQLVGCWGREPGVDGVQAGLEEEVTEESTHTC